jgi:hypothetical protein
MASSLRDALLSFAAGALVALVTMRVVPALVLRSECGGACTTNAASTDATTQQAGNPAPKGGPLGRLDAASGTSSEPGESGGGLYVMLAPEATTSWVAPSPEAATPEARNAETPSSAESAAPVATPLNPAGATTPVGSLDGWWLVTNAVAPEGPRVVYRIELHRDGERLSGKGSTWSKNGRALAPSQRTPTMVTGTWRADRVELTLAEHATRGTRRVHVEWQPTAHGEAFAGHFAGDAAHTGGRSEAVRDPNGGADESREEPRRSRHHAPREEPRRPRRHATTRRH